MLSLSLYIYIRHRASGTQGVFDPMAYSASLWGRRGSKILFFKGNQGHYRGSPVLPEITRSMQFSAFFRALFQTAIFESKDPKGLPKGAPNCLKVQIILKKSAATSGLEIGPEQRRSQMWKLYSRQRSRSIFNIPRQTGKHAKWNPKRQKCKHITDLGSHQNMENHTAIKSAKVSKWHQNKVPNKVMF